MKPEPLVSPCPNCQGKELYEVDASSGFLLPGLGTLFKPASVRGVMCSTCGLMRYFASAEDRKKLDKSRRWTKIDPA